MLARNGYAQLMKKAERMNKKKDSRENGVLIPAADEKFSALSLLKERTFLEHAGSRLPSMFLTYTNCSHLNLCKPPSRYIKNAEGDRNCVRII